VNATTSGGEPALASNPFDLRADRGLANFDVRNAAVINATYALHLGHGRAFLHAADGLVHALAGGWTVNSIVTVQGGFPFTPQLSYNPSNNGDTRNPVRLSSIPPSRVRRFWERPRSGSIRGRFWLPPTAAGSMGTLAETH